MKKKWRKENQSMKQKLLLRWGSIAQFLADLLSDPAALGSNPYIPPQKKIYKKDFVDVDQQRFLEQSRQRL